MTALKASVHTEFETCGSSYRSLDLIVTLLPPEKFPSGKPPKGREGEKTLKIPEQSRNSAELNSSYFCGPVL